MNPLVQNELIVWKTDSRFFSLASHVLPACEARARLLRHALPISLLIFGEIKRLFCSLVLKRGLGVIRKWPVLYQKYIICWEISLARDMVTFFQTNKTLEINGNLLSREVRKLLFSVLRREQWDNMLLGVAIAIFCTVCIEAVALGLDNL